MNIKFILFFSGRFMKYKTLFSLFRHQKHITSFVLLLFAAVFLFSCAGGERQKQKSEAHYAGNANFIVEEVTKPLNLDPVILNTKQGLPESFTVNLRACIKYAIRKDTSIQDTVFFIEYESHDDQLRKKLYKARAVSDSNGCIQWEERYRYKFVKNPPWIQLNRVIKTKNNASSGEVLIPMAVNPWLTESDKDRPAILDIRSHYSRNHTILKENIFQKEGLDFLITNSKKEFPQLWASYVEVQIETDPRMAQRKEICSDEKKCADLKKEEQIRQLLSSYSRPCQSSEDELCNKRYLKLNFLIPLKLRGYNTKGDIIDNEINGGKYDINIQLVVIPDEIKQPYRLHDYICKHQKVALNEGQTQETRFLSLECPVRIPYFNKNAKYKVYVEIKPDEVLNFKKFQGSYTFQFDFSGVKKKYVIDTDIDKEYRDVLKTTNEINLFTQEDIKNMYDVIFNEDKSLETDSHSFHQPVLDGVNIFKYANVENTRDCKNNDNVVKRIVTFTGRICLTDTLTNNKPRQIHFRVFLEKPDTVSVESGKVTLEEIFDTKAGKQKTFQTDQEGCIDLPIPIKHNIYNRQQYFPVDIHFLSEEFNFYAHVKAALNPWQRAFQAHQDASKLSEQAIRFHTDGVQKPNLIINQFKSVNLFPSYVLDKFLNIHLYHRVYFLFQPFIQRHDNVALGLDHRSRELLRDGYYMVRLLLLRNPQETKKLHRVLTEEELKRSKSEVLNERLGFDTKNAEYISHTDTIIPVQANFVNLYMPLYVTTKQLYYVASRNLISIEIVPVDPAGYYFKEVQAGDACELDLEKTKWKAYYDHELMNRPYVGAFNIQNWTNWNILRHADLDSDVIIEKSEIGREYKLFNLSREQQNFSTIGSGQINRACINGERIDEEPTAKQIAECTGSKETLFSQNSALQSFIEVQIQKDQGDVMAQSHSVLKEYAEQNALRVLELSTAEGDHFEQDIKKALERLNIRSASIDLEEIGAYLPVEHKEALEKDIETQCSTGFFSFFNSDKECHNNVIKVYIEALQKEKETAENLNQKTFLSSILESIHTQSESYNSFLRKNTKLDKEKLIDIIDNRVNSWNANRPEVLNFAQSMCYFWFDSYFQNYLKPEQMLAAYTNYIRKFDYYKVLEAEGIREDMKFSSLNEFVRLVGIGDPKTESDDSFLTCHEEYTECIVSDHCQLSLLNKVKRGYCDKLQFNNIKNSCKELVDTECEIDSSLSLCYLNLEDQKDCSNRVNNFCVVNKDHPLCYKFSNRCLRNYRSCMKSENARDIFNLESIIKLKCLRSPYKEYKICLDDPANKEKQCGNDLYKLLEYRAKKCVSTHNPLLKSCLENPYHFFNFENKMIIQELSDENTTYREGLLRNFSVTGNFSLGSYMNWTSQRGHSMSLTPKVGLKAASNLKVFGLGLDLGLSESMSSNTSNSSRRAVDVRAGEGAFFAIAEAILEVGVKEFQKCLVIRPRPHSFFSYFEKGDNYLQKNGLFYGYKENRDPFWTKEAKGKDFKKIFVSRPGLIICNPVQKTNEGEEERIVENYYYITQNMTDPSNSQFLNLYDLANRPFMNILRGRTEFIKYYHMMKSIVEGDNGNINENLNPREPPENMFIDYTHPVEEAVGLSLKLREFRQTGFYPGVYHYSEDSDKAMDIIFAKEGKDFMEGIFSAYSKNVNLMSIPTYPNNQIPVSEER